MNRPALHAIEEPQATRQEYATAAIQLFQRGYGIKRFADLVRVFRDAGREYDQWERQRGAA